MKVLRIFGILLAAVVVIADIAEAGKQMCDGFYFCWNSAFEKTLDCSGQNLPCIPAYANSPYPKLDFHRNKIETLPNYAFKTQFSDLSALAEVTELDLSENKLTKIEPFAFAGLNKLKNLNLKSNQLRNPPIVALLSTAVHLTKLILASNPIQTLRPQEFIDLTHLKELDLGFCKLGTIDPNAFAGLGRLEILALNGNELKEIPRGTFHHLRKLETLNLAHNKIHTFHLDDLKGLLNLKIVALENNPMPIPEACFQCQPRWTGELTIAGWNLHSAMGATSVLKPNAFKFQIPDTEKLTTIIDLDLSYNRISRIEPGAFAGFRILDNVSLSENQLTKVPIEALSEIRTLSILSLNNNPLGPSLAPRQFSELTYLDDLDLSYCGFQNIDESAFIGMRYLKKLNLAGNFIKIIKSNTFSHLRKLETLDLSNNNIQTWEPDTLKGLEALETVRLENNPIKIPEDCLPCIPRWTAGRISENTWNLSSSGNQIKILSKDIFKHQFRHEKLFVPCQFKKIETLDLSFNFISRIDPGAFSGMVGLTQLDLSSNNFMNISNSATFSDIQQLKSLSFKSTPLRKITPHVFSPLNNLIGLDLSYCELQEIDISSFDGLISLKKLILNGNHLVTIKPLTFSNVRNLESLYLSGNQISTLAPDAFAGLSLLNFLDLSENAVNLTQDDVKMILALGVIPNSGQLHTELDRSDLLESANITLSNIPCNCDQFKKICVGTWGSTPDGELKCNLHRSLAFKLSKFVEVNVGEFVFSGFIVFMLALIVYQMISNYNSSPM